MPREYNHKRVLLNNQAEILKHVRPPLSKEEEIRCGILIQAGFAAEKCLNGEAELPGWTEDELHGVIKAGKAARDTLLYHNLALAVNIAQKFKESTCAKVDLEDIIQSSLMGLVKAIDKYDPARGTKFVTMAYPWVALDARRNTNRIATPVMVPEDKITMAAKIFKLEEEFTSDGKPHRDTDKEIAEILSVQGKRKVTKDLVRSVRNGVSDGYSLNWAGPSVAPEDGQDTLSIYVSDSMAEQVGGVHEHMYNTRVNTMIAEYLSQLLEHERAVMSYRFGFPMGDGTVASRSDVRKRFKVSVRDEETIAINVMSGLQDALVSLGVESVDDYTRTRDTFSL